MSVLSTQKKTMQAAVFAGPGSIEVRETPLPEPGPNQVRVRLEGCGLCASNLEPFEGRPWFQYPFEPGAPGHEGWGVIDALGEGADERLNGQRVACLSYNAYAQYDLAGDDAVAPLPSELDGVPFPAEPLACALNVFRRSEIQEGQNVAVIGIGFLGALLVSLTANAGARVAAISRRSYALDVARERGAAETIPMDDQEKVVERVRRFTDDDLCERVIECTGAQEALDLATELAAIRGRIVIAGYHQDGPRQVNMQQWNWRGLDVVNAHERDQRVYVRGMKEAINAVAEKRLQHQPLLTHEFALDELEEGFRLMRERPEGYLKGWVRL
jgi:threonine dehydrogenase-like Zn-dependent dehydrogenase